MSDKTADQSNGLPGHVWDSKELRLHIAAIEFIRDTAKDEEFVAITNSQWPTKRAVKAQAFLKEHGLEGL